MARLAICRSLLIPAGLMACIDGTAGAATKVSVPPASSVTCNVRATGEETQELVRAEATRLGVDPKLAIAVLDQESHAGLELNSSAGARGPMQLMPSTATRYGVADICDPVQNVRGGIAYLRDLLAEFGGDVLLALAAYNSGEERVYRARGIPPIGETVRYVAAIANNYYGYGKKLAAKRLVPKAAAGISPSDSFVKDVGSVPPDGTQPKWIGGSVLYVEQGDQ